jgi:hypothetical protein
MPAHSVDNFAALKLINEIGRGHTTAACEWIVDSRTDAPLGASSGTSKADVLMMFATASSCHEGGGRTVRGNSVHQLSPFTGKIWVINDKILIGVTDVNPTVMVYGFAD